jgi:gliding motility-associated-like protein/uncharacterized repeat protein (TIGR01451 family)
MLKSIKLLFFLIINLSLLSAQTTDLSINIEAQNLAGTPISQVNIYEDFQYLITLSNSGNATNNANISVDFDDDITIISTSSQNTINGASDVSDITITDNVLTGIITILPNNSSVELLVLVSAPTNIGGIAVNGTINPSAGTTDTNTSNNQSIISIDVLDIVIDFEITHTQIQPASGIPIDNWGDEVTYQFTITNNSEIDFPIETIEGKLILTSPFDNGQPFAEFISLDCISATNGTLCPETIDPNTISANITTPNVVNAPSIFTLGDDLEITSGGSITFEMVYRYTNFSCSPNPMPIDVDSFIEISLNHTNASSNLSNFVETNLPNADMCPLTDVCIETELVDPVDTIDIEYEQEVTFVTTVCNNGPSEAPLLLFLQNLSPNVNWDIISVNCTATTGPVACGDFTISDNGQLWVSNEFVLQPNTTIIIETVVVFVEPPCNPFPTQVDGSVKSQITLLPTQTIDTNPDNNFHFIDLILPIEEPCDVQDISDLQVTKTQVLPELPVGGSQSNTTEWGEITYEVTITNDGDTDEPIQVQDHMPVPLTGDVPIIGTLISVECTGTTGTASCFSIENASTGIPFDGVTEDGSFDTFWEILPEDNWILPANSSVSFTVTVDWQPECSSQPMVGTNYIRAYYVNNVPETNLGNNIDSVDTYFAPCIDLVVQTYPESAQVDTGEAFNWIVDISNSTTSSSAIDIQFENILDNAFTISGSPTCSVSSGSATCISAFNISGNTITGIIPTMEAGSTIRITIPVLAPNFGGGFNNIAEAFPSAADNEELTPETNISVNSVQVISPILDKVFIPNTIFEGGESELVFTIYNIATSPTQNGIAFTDNLPTGLTLSSLPIWVEANGCSATFNGTVGGDFVGVTDLTFPAGVESCSFSVMVTSDIAGTYLNDFQNISNTNNLDASQVSAALDVVVDTSDVDIEILKSVEPSEAIVGQQVTFTITATNIGTSQATAIHVLDALPMGYEYISATTSFGIFDDTAFSWSIPFLDSNQAETLQIDVLVVSSTDLLNIAFLDGLNEIDRDSSNNEDDAIVEISNCLLIPQGISPNGDLENDYLIIPCIESYPDNTIKIYNRYGALIYESNNYNNSWDGRANRGAPKYSGLLPVGTYFYILEVSGIAKPIQGYVYLNY